jgi:hypothetical protein
VGAHQTFGHKFVSTFNQQFSEAIDSSRPFWQRQSRFRSCVSIYCKECELSYQETLTRYESFYWIGESQLQAKIGRCHLHHRGDQNRDHHLDWALGTLLSERSQFVTKLARVREKQLRLRLRGMRIPNDLEESLREVDWIPFPVNQFRPKPQVLAQEKRAESGRGDGIAPVTPPTPPDMRVRIRRFQSDDGDRP